MQLLTQELLRRIPPLYSSETEPDPLVVCKFFTPDAHWTWYVIEGGTYMPDNPGSHDPLTAYDPERHDILFFGYVVGDFPELGYFRLTELEGVRGVLRLPVERDRYFMPRRLSELKPKVKA
jgi:DUF2958 family protein